MSRRSGSPGVASATAARLASLSNLDRVVGLRRASRGAGRRSARRASRGWVRRSGVPRCRSISPAAPTTTATGRAWIVGEVVERPGDEPLGEAVDDLIEGRSRGVDGDAALADDVADEVERQRRDVVDVDLGADAAHGTARRARRSSPGVRRRRARQVPSRTRPRSASSATRLETVALLSWRSSASRARERGPSSRRLRSTSAEVGPAQRALVSAAQPHRSPLCRHRALLPDLLPAISLAGQPN